MAYWDIPSDIRFLKRISNQKFGGGEDRREYLNFEIPSIKEIKNVTKKTLNLTV